MTDPTEGREDATTPTGFPTNHWLLQKLQRGEMTVQEFLKLSKIRGDDISTRPMDTSKRRETQ